MGSMTSSQIRMLLFDYGNFGQEISFRIDTRNFVSYDIIFCCDVGHFEVDWVPDHERCVKTSKCSRAR